MDIIDFMRANVQRIINDNPTTITIERTQKIEIDGYYTESTSIAGPFTVRIFQGHALIPQQINTLAGIKQVEKTWGLLADYQADLQTGSNVKDEFNAPHLGRFVIIAVYPRKKGDAIVGYQADLERVS